MADLDFEDKDEVDVQGGEGSRQGQRSKSRDSDDDISERDARSDFELELEAKSVEEGDSCLICLGSIVDRSVLPTCLHSLFCFACIEKWTSLHRRCPLCSADVGTYIIHRIRSDDDYVRHALPPLPAPGKGKAREVDASEDDPVHARAALIQREAARTRAQRAQSSDQQHGTRDWREKAAERWNAQLSRRRRVYRQGLYCLHVGSNRSTKLAPPPSPQDIAATPVLQSTLWHFVRRELLAFPRANIDVDFLANYILILLKEVDIRSDAAVNLLADFLDNDGAQHFCHELYTFLRFVGRGSGAIGSGRRPGLGGSTGVLRDRILAFDQWAQYSWPEERLSREALARQRARLQRQEGTARSAATSGANSTPTTANITLTPDALAIDVPDPAQLRHEVIARRAKWLDELSKSREDERAADRESVYIKDKQRLRLTELAKQRLERLQACDKDDELTPPSEPRTLAERLAPIPSSKKRRHL